MGHQARCPFGNGVVRVRPYLELLRRPGAVSITIAHTLGRLTPGMILLALILALREGGYAYAVVGLVTGAHQLGVAISSPLQGRLADVLGHRLVLLPDGIVYFVGTSTLAVGVTQGWSVVPLVLVGLATGLFSPPMTACARAAFGAMFPTGRERERAFILTGANIEFGFLVGPLLTVAIAGTVGARFAVVGAGAGVLVGAIVYASGPRVDATGPRVNTDGASRWSGGAFGALRSRGLRAMVVVYLGIAATFGLFDIFAASVSEDAGRPGFAGTMISVIAFASLVSGFVYGTRIWRGTLRERMLVLAMLFVGVYLLLAAAAGDLRLLIGVVFIAGAIVGPLNVCGFQLIDDVSPPRARAEAQSWTQASIYLGSALGGAVGGVVVDLLGPRAVAQLAALVALVAVVTLWRSRSLRAGAQHSAAVALVTQEEGSRATRPWRRRARARSGRGV
jgi:MFS family permease